MAKDDFRFSLSAEKYLEKHHVLTYIEDAITQLLDHKDENSRVNPSKFFGDYFTCVKEGNHVMFREYSFVHATSHNRASFVRTFWKCFCNIGRKGDLLSAAEYHALICLLCPNFPFEPVQKTARIILMDDALDSLISFADFIYAFQTQFCFDEFLKLCAGVYQDLLHKPQNSHDTVVVPTSEESPKVYKNSTGSSAANGVDSMVFFRSLLPVCERLDIVSPPVPVLREILSSAQRVTYYGFLMEMAKNSALNERIGKLPKKSSLWTVSDPELTSAQLKHDKTATTMGKLACTPSTLAHNPAQPKAEMAPCEEVEPPINPKSPVKVCQASSSVSTHPAAIPIGGASHITTTAPPTLTATKNASASLASMHLTAERPPRPRSVRLATLRDKALQRDNASSVSDSDTESGSSTN